MAGEYFEQVYDIVRLIPEGRISTYGAIADYLSLGSARMVGWALRHCNHGHGDVPAQRVTNRKGELTGRHHFKPPELMAELLRDEGISVEKDKVQDFDKYFWHPQELD